MKHPTYSNGDPVLIGDETNAGAIFGIDPDIVWIVDAVGDMSTANPLNLILIERAADAPQP